MEVFVLGDDFDRGCAVCILCGAYLPKLHFIQDWVALERELLIPCLILDRNQTFCQALALMCQGRRPLGAHVPLG